MSDYRAFLRKLNKNLNFLKERKAKYAGNEPPELLNKIDDHQEAIDLTQQVIAEEITEAEWQEAMKPLLVSLPDEVQAMFDQRGQHVQQQTNVAGGQVVIHHHYYTSPTGDYPPDRADIHLKIKISKYGFGRSHGSRSPFRGLRGNQGGFNKQGVPDWGTLWANHIEIANHGEEDGILDCDIDQMKTKFPSLFAFEKDKFNIEFHPPRKIPGRETLRENLFFDILFTEQEPRAFAQALKALVEDDEHYQVVIKYKTQYVDGESEFRYLYIKGDFQDFHREILTYWEGYGFNELAELGRLD
jgi:hypothetical protein